MNEVMRSILLMSAAGSVFTCIVLCLKPVTGRIFSPRWQYYIWLAVLLVMVLPIRLSLPAEPIQIIAPGNADMQSVQESPQAVQETKQPATPDNMLQKSYFEAPEIPASVMQISGYLWLAGALLLFGYRLIKYLLFLRVIRKNSVADFCIKGIPESLTARKTGLLDAPLVIGLIKPVLYLPQAGFKQEELNYILLHELTHYRRHDLLYKWFTMLVSSIHWFNPFVYIVSRQIDEECEVSCDWEVCKSLTEPQKRDYMAMILDFIQTAIRKKRPLTTQMISSKKIIKRRFIMIKTKRASNRLVSVLSVVVAFAMLSTTVFASGILSGLTEEDYTIEIASDNGTKLEFVNKPVIENGEVYVPLRETFGMIGYHAENSYIHWNNGTIDIAILNSQGDNGLYRLEIGNAVMQLRHFQGDDLYSADMDDKSMIRMTMDVSNANAPILRDSTTYLPLDMINYIVYGFLNIRNDDNSLRELTYTIYDKEGNILDSSTIEKLLQNPEYVISHFFGAFSQREFDAMKQFCTEACVADFFGNGYVFGMTEATLTDIEIDPLEYTKSSNDFIAVVSVDMTPHENSVFDPNQTSTEFYLILMRQPDGRYLIDEFATGL